MKLSELAEEAFDKAVEAAYEMQDAQKEHGIESYQFNSAMSAYVKNLQQYYALTRDGRELFWEDRCKDRPWREECKIYDC